jgi:hypothetical protein
LLVIFLNTFISRSPCHFLRSCFSSADDDGFPPLLLQLLHRIDAYRFEEEPDYAALRHLIVSDMAAYDSEDEVTVNLAIQSPDKENRDPKQVKRSIFI